MTVLINSILNVPKSDNRQNGNLFHFVNYVSTFDNDKKTPPDN